MAKIAFWSSGYATSTTDACTFYRAMEPARVLRKLGHETQVSHQFGLGTLLEQDVVVIERPTETGPHVMMDNLLKLPERARPRIVIELDDDLLDVPGHNPAHSWMQNPARRSRLREALRRADYVVVTGDHLAARARFECGNQLTDGRVRVVPNYVPERFVVPNVPDDVERLTITWAGTDTHRRDFDEVAIPLRRLLRERTDFRVRIIGAPYAARLWTSLSGPDLPLNRVVQVPWVPGVERYIQALSGHIGLAPLADDLFNRSKSDLRLKELAARGMAVAASTAGPYAESLVPRAWVGETPGQTWTDALTWLLDRPEHREHVAAEGLAWAQDNTLEMHATEWEKALLA
jgi:hypothetical protein